MPVAVAVAHPVMRQDHSVGVAELGQPGHRVQTLVEPREAGPIQPEAVHANGGAVAHELAQAVEIGGVTGVADDDPREVDALIGEPPLLSLPVWALVCVLIGTPVMR